MNPLGEMIDTDVQFSFLEEKTQTTQLNYNSCYDDPNHICIQLSSLTQDDFATPKSTKNSIELKRKKNREAAKRSRQKKKQSIMNLINENKLLNAQIAAMRSEMERKLCYECKCQMNLKLINIEEENTLSNSPSASFTKSYSNISNWISQ